MTTVAQAHSDLKHAQSRAERPGLSDGARQSARKIVDAAQSKLDRVVQQTIREMEQAGYRVAVRR